MSIFDTPSGNDPRFVEATVLGVDNIRFVCKVFSDFKQAFDAVPWASNIYDTPVFGDRVRVDNVQGYPIITAILSRAGAASTFSPDIHDGSPVDTGNYSTLSRGLVLEPEKPKDLVSGDRVISNSMGGLFGLLKGGTVIARASQLAQILICKYDDLVRIVARSFELFTDVSTDVTASVRGRAYRYTAYADTLSAGRSSSYKYIELTGDTVLGDNLRSSYYGLNPTTYAALPAADTIIRKYKIENGGTLFYQDLHSDSGRYFTQVQNSAASAYTYVDYTNATFDVKTSDGTYTRITTTPTSVIIQYNGTNKITIDSGKIECDFNGVTKATLDSTKVQLIYVAGNNTITADVTGVSMLYSAGAHFVNVTTAGVSMG